MRGETLSSEEEKQILNSLSKSGTEEVDAESLAVSAPQANAYEFQSQEVVDVLQKLVDKFDKERETIEQEEVHGKYAYEMLMQDQSKAKAKALQAAADVTTDLADASTTMQDDQRYLLDLTAICEQRALAVTDRQKV